ncbi:MAG: UvrB/UvrC motif-containing protein [Candidatus Zixiibacteriota bacterium]
MKITQIVNNEKATLHLCKQCAAARGFHSPLENVPFPLAEILSGLASKPPAVTKKGTRKSITCDTCGLTFDEFTKQGRFGCGGCYRAFRHELEPIMRRIHGASLHRGRGPLVVAEKGDQPPLPVKEEERLEEELKKAINSEDYERAAEIRDKLKTIRHS